MSARGNLKSSFHRYLPGGLMYFLSKKACKIKCGFEDSVANVDLSSAANQPILVLLNHSNNITRNKDVFVDCSEISINVIVKHGQHVGIICVCSPPGMGLLRFSVPGGTEKLLGCGFLGGINT